MEHKLSVDMKIGEEYTLVVVMGFVVLSSLGGLGVVAIDLIQRIVQGTRLDEDTECC